jgi:antitoxin component YwqK of YwqJK toxin-antitoxin module
LNLVCQQRNGPELSSSSIHSIINVDYFANMKLQILIVSIFISSQLLHSQKIEKFYNYQWKEVTDVTKARFYSIIEKKDSLWQRQDFYIREAKLQMTGYYKDAECKVEQGEFTWFHPNGHLQTIGKYINGKKNGVWLSFHDNGMMSDSVSYNENGWVFGTRLGWHANGQMADSTVINPDGSGVSVYWWENGNPSAAGRYAPGYKLHGKWQYFRSNGQLASLETYNYGKLIDKEYYDETGVKQTDTTNRDRAASFPGGLDAWQKYLQKNLYFPSQYQFVNGDQAVVMVRFAVNEDGSVSEPTVTISLHPDFDKIALDVIRRSPKWIPAISHNRKIKEYHSQPVTFAQREN